MQYYPNCESVQFFPYGFTGTPVFSYPTLYVPLPYAYVDPNFLPAEAPYEEYADRNFLPAEAPYEEYADMNFLPAEAPYEEYADRFESSPEPNHEERFPQAVHEVKRKSGPFEQMFRLCHDDQKWTNHSSKQHLVLDCIREAIVKVSRKKCRLVFNGSAQEKPMRHSDLDLLFVCQIKYSDQRKLEQIARQIYDHPQLQQFDIKRKCGNVFTFTLQEKTTLLPSYDMDVTLVSSEIGEDDAGQFHWGLGEINDAKHFYLDSQTLYEDVYAALANTGRYGYTMEFAITICRALGLPHFIVANLAESFDLSHKHLKSSKFWWNTLTAHFLAYLANFTKLLMGQDGDRDDYQEELFTLITDCQKQKFINVFFPGSLFDPPLNPNLRIFIEQTDDEISARIDADTRMSQLKMLVYIMVKYYYDGPVNIYDDDIFYAFLEKDEEFVTENVEWDESYRQASLKRLCRLGSNQEENKQTLLTILSYISRTKLASEESHDDFFVPIFEDAADILENAFCEEEEETEQERQYTNRFILHNWERALRDLNIPEDSILTLANVNKAYRTLMRSAHPDHGGSTESAQILNEAKDILIVGIKRNLI
jgi:hypothetical protein